VRDFTSRLTLTVDAYFTAENAEEAEREVAKIMEDLEDLDVSLAGRRMSTEAILEVIALQADGPTEMSP
jgi:hypothetical protein